MSEKNALREIIETLLQRPDTPPHDIGKLKIQIAQKYRLDKVPSNSQIITMLKAEEESKLLPVLRRKATRTISGVTVVAVMTKPHPCPQGSSCAYCPGGPSVGTPQSYTGLEPAAMRGQQNKFDPHQQVRSRIEQLRAIGHEVDKVELIVMGGTFPATPPEYQTWFIKRCLDSIAGRSSSTLEEAKKNAETSRVRNVGITVETRPDWAKEQHVDQMLNMGVTRVEMGVQNPSDRIYTLVGRGHTTRDVIEATRIMKDSGLKVAYHLMPGLPGSSRKGDLEAFQRIFNDSDFKPDMIKIYPCLVIKGTKTYEWYLAGNYRPYTTSEAIDFIAEVKKTVPPWVRIMRVQRDIPSQLIVAGANKSNLRQHVQRKLKERNIKCKCIRCREVGQKRALDNLEPDSDSIEIVFTKYAASQGEEIFISAEDVSNDVLVGYLRLRVPSNKAHRPEVKAEPCSVVRELHVYGPLVPVGKHAAKAWQHKGFGLALLAEAERLTLENYKLKKILIISALGTKPYYKRFGYEYDGVYMSKLLRN